MGYEYDSKVNRDLARTAMSIYTKSQGIKPQEINESKQNLNEEVIRENVNGLIMNYISDVIILAEAEMGREMTDIEISEASDELLRRIDSISDEEKTAFVTELAEAAGVVGGRGAGIDTGAAAGGSGKGRPSGLGTVAAGGGGNINPRDYTSIDDYINTIGDDFDGADLAQILNYASQGGYENSGTGTVGVRSGGNPRRRTGQAVREAVANNNLPVNNYSSGNQVGAGAGEVTSNTPSRGGTTVTGTFKRPKNRAGGGVGDTPIPGTDFTLSDYGPGGSQAADSFGGAFTGDGSLTGTVGVLYTALGYNVDGADFDPSVAGQLAAQLQTLWQ